MSMDSHQTKTALSADVSDCDDSRPVRNFGQDPRASTIVNRLGGRSIVLVGIMGSGKTSVGRRLAARLGLEFMDADSEIEAAAGMTIAEIFAQHGEAYFRNGEKRVIERLLRERPRVLATGGGAFMHPETREAISRSGVSVWLKADHDVLMRRVRKRTNRPLLQTDDPDAVMRRLMEERYPVYATADITVQSQEGPHDAVVAQIVEALSSRFGGGSARAEARVQVNLAASSYDIVIAPGLLERAGDHIANLFPGRRCALISDSNVAGLHLPRLRHSLAERHVSFGEIVVAPGEASKSLPVFADVCDKVLAGKFERQDVIVALGGGVVGDLAGFAAACIRRGMRFVQIPTTLLAQVDSSVGGKTAVNTSQGKNLLGAFYQPDLVLADTALLETLPAREFRGGYAEVVKYGLINNAMFFAWLEEHCADIHARKPALTEAIRICCQAKADVVVRDETEKGDRALLNLGHTFAHALEALCGYDSTILNHGEAVAVGLACASRFSAHLRYMPAQEAERVARHLQKAGLPTRIQDIAADGVVFTCENILNSMYQDKKVSAGELTFVLMRGIGKSFIAPKIPANAVLEFLAGELEAD